MAIFPKSPLLRLLVCMMVGTIVISCSKNSDHHNYPNLTTGQDLYNYHCAECHGEDGTGHLVDKTPASILITKAVEGIEEYIVTDTGPRRKKPLFSSVPRAESHKIAEYLIVLKNRYDNLGENQRKNRELLIDPGKRE